LIDRLDYPIMFSEACQESDSQVFKSFSKS